MNANRTRWKKSNHTTSGRWRRVRRAVVLALAAAMSITASGPAPVFAVTAWQPAAQGTLQIVNDDLQAPAKLFSAKTPAVAPLKHTDVKVKIRGFVAEVTVTQEFRNPIDRPIEAVYVFPLPHDSAVNATEMRIGKRVIRGKIDRRKTARQKYQSARDQGKRASLLEQERPNVFTQSLANIGPGETIHVVIRYVQALPYKDGAYELAYPMVVGPRYIPGSGRVESGQSGHGRIPDNQRVPDASRITPPTIEPGRRCGFDISIAVDVDAGTPIQNIVSRAHKITIERSGESRASVLLDPADSVPNKDFVLNIATAGKHPEIGMVAHHNGKIGHFTMVVQPPKAPAEDQIRPREVICIIDVSGSMSGRPLDLARKGAIKLLNTLRQTDRFNIYVFSNQSTSLSSTPLTANDQNLRKGVAYVKGLRARGGTNMLSGIRSALSQRIPETHLRIIAMFTDGYIGNEIEILAEVKRNVSTARFCTFGTGSSINRYLLDRIARLGGGLCEVILLNDKPGEVIERFANRMAKPVLTDVRVKIDGVEVVDCIPARVADLYDGIPVYVHGRYKIGGKADITITGRIGAEPSTANVKFTFPDASTDSSPIPSIWARQRIKELQLAGLDTGNQNEYVQEITQLALDYSLMSKYTSFVAVDETPTQFRTRPDTVPVEVPIPDGVKYETTVDKSAAEGQPSSRINFGPGIRIGTGGGGPVGPISLAVIALLAIGAGRRRKKTGKLPDESPDGEQSPAPPAS